MSDRPRILIAEDDASLRRVLARVLERAGYFVLEAENGIQALALASENASDLTAIVTDVKMPAMDGPQFVEELGRLGLGVVPPVLFISAYPEQVPMMEGRDRSAFLPKPFRPEVLVDALLRLRRKGEG